MTKVINVLKAFYSNFSAFFSPLVMLVAFCLPHGIMRVVLAVAAIVLAVVPSVKIPEGKRGKAILRVMVETVALLVVSMLIATIFNPNWLKF